MAGYSNPDDPNIAFLLLEAPDRNPQTHIAGDMDWISHGHEGDIRSALKSLIEEVSFEQGFLRSRSVACDSKPVATTRRNCCLTLCLLHQSIPSHE